MKKVNILLVDDHKLFRNGLKMLLQNYDNLAIIGEVANGKEFIEFNKLNLVHIALVDIDMPVIDGVEATKTLLPQYPDLKIIALSMYSDYDYYYKMIHAGAKGYILKNTDISEVLKAIEIVEEGGTYFAQEILVGLVKNFNNASNSSTDDFDISDREMDVLKLICKGLSNQEIANQLHISKRTVDKHRSNLLSKSNSKNTASLVIFAIKNKLVSC